MDLSLSNLIEQVETKLTDLSYSTDTIRHYRYHWGKLQKFCDERNLESLTQDIARDAFFAMFNVKMDAQSEHNRYARMGRRAIEVLLDYQDTGTIYRRQRRKDHQFQECYEPIASEYMAYIKDTQARTSFRQHQSKLEDFLGYLHENDCTDLSRLTKTHILGFWKTRSSVSKTTKTYDAYALRKFFDYLYEHGYTTVDNSVFVPNVKGRRNGQIPSFYTAAELSALLAAVDRENPTGKRDYAILLLAIRYGIRAGDIRNLKLQDLNWNEGTLSFIQSKTERRKTFRLLDDVATALADYFKNGRPTTSCKHIFIRHNAPYDAFGADNNMHHIISKYMKLAGFTDFHKRKHGLHSMRHSIAGNLLDQGVPMQTVAEVIDHASSDTTMIYTKISMGQLGNCPLEVD